jgi:epidermal growth factor receptor substrate 15
MRAAILLIFLILSLVGLGQSRFVLYGAVTNDDMNRREGDVSVTVTHNGNNVTSTMTSNSGKFKVNLDYGKKYKVEFSKAGLVTRHILIDLVGINEEDLPAGDLAQELEMTLYAPVPGVDMTFFATDPTTTFSVNMKKAAIEMDKKQEANTKTKVTAMLEQRNKAGDQSEAINKKFDEFMAAGDKSAVAKKYEEALKSYQEAEKLKPTETLPKSKIAEMQAKIKEAEELKKQAENEAKFNAAVQEADKAFVAKEWNKALAKYEEALKYKKDDKHCVDRLIAIEDILREQREAELKNKQQNEEYTNLIKAADSFRDKKEYDKAVAKYEEALKVKQEQYPKDQIRTIKEIQDKEAAAKKVEEDYKAAMAEAKSLFDSENYQGSREKYQVASGIKPNEAEPKNKIKEIDELLKNLAANKEKEEAYKKALEEANALFASEKWEDAKSAYQKASGIKPAETYPAEQIKVIDEKIKNLAADKLKNENYQKKIAEADQLFATDKLDAAKKAYEEALKIKENEAYPTERIALINQTLLERGQAAERQQQFEKTMKEADVLFAAQKWDEAREKYQAALGIKPDETKPKTQIEEIDKKLGELAAKNAQEKAYQDAIAEGTNLLNSGDLLGAKGKFETASGLKPNEKLPKDKLAEINKKLEEEAKNKALFEQYNKLIADADKLFADNKLEQARAAYVQANQLKADAYPQGRITEIDARIADATKKAQQEKAYADKIAQADQLFGSGKLEQAKAVYQEAQGIDASKSYPTEQIQKIDKQLADQQSAAEKEANFNKFVNEGKSLEQGKQLKEAIESYSKALAYKDDAQIKTKIAELTKRIADEEAHLNQEQKYQAALASAQNNETAQRYEQAIQDYKQAQSIKPSESLPGQKIAELQKLMQDQAKQKEIQDKFDKIVKDGDQASGAGNLSLAKSKYEEALAVINRPDVQEKLNDIERRMKEETVNEQERSYRKIVDKADQLKNAKDYENAISYYERALTIKANDPYPAQMIKEIKQQIDEEKNKQKQQAELDKQYNELLKLGEKKIADKDLYGALETFANAKSLKPSETLPTQRIEYINNLLASQAQSEKAEQDYKRFMAEGNKKADNKQYSDAIASFNLALQSKPNDAEAQKRISEMNALIEKDKNAQKDMLYAEWIGRGNRAFGDKEYDVAKNAYQEALKAKANDKFALDRIAEIDQIMTSMDAQKKQQAESEAAYKAILSEADLLFVKEDWKNAAARYQDAVNMRPTDSYPKKQIDVCIQKQKEESEKEAEAQYRKIINRADELFEQDEWDKAIDMYQRALALRSSDKYPKDRIAEIERIKKSGGKRPVKLEDLGTRSDVSILDGEAAFVKAEEARKNVRNKRVKKGMEDIQKKEESTMIEDLAERLGIRKVVTDMEREKAAMEEIKGEEQQAMAQEVKQLVVKQDEKSEIDNLFKYAELLKQEAYARQVVIEKEAIATEKTYIPKDNEQLIINQQTEILQKLRNDGANEYQLHLETRQLVVEVQDKHTGFEEENRKAVAANEESVKELAKKLVTLSDEDLANEFVNIQNLIKDLQTVETNKTASEEELLAISKDIDDKVKAMNKEIVDRATQRGQEHYSLLKRVEGKIIEVDRENEAKSVERDEDRLATVGTVKQLIRGEEDAQTERRQDHKSQRVETKGAISKVEDKLDQKNEESDEARQATTQTVKGLQKTTEESQKQKEQDKTKDLYLTKQTVSNVEEGVRKETDKAEKKPRENEETLKVTAKDLEDQQAKNLGESKERKQNLMKTLEEMERKGVKFSEAVANDLGQEFPEGVTEQNFTQEDEFGLLVAMKTRRIVVKNGRGDVYVRSSNKFGTTYTKNGIAITEYIWQKETQDASLVRHKTN